MCQGLSTPFEPDYSRRSGAHRLGAPAPLLAKSLSNLTLHFDNLPDSPVSSCHSSIDDDTGPPLEIDADGDLNDTLAYLDPRYGKFDLQRHIECFLI